jgi:hypothetical protein
METMELLFDGDIRGYRTGKDCVLALADTELWKDSIALTNEERAIVESESDSWLDIVEDCIDKAKCTHKGHTWTLHWIEGSIFAVRDDHEWDD